MVGFPISDAQTVADEFLKAAKRNGKQLTSMQLMKLTYIAHGWSLAILGRDLFMDRIEAWKFGPVIPSLYRTTKRFGRDPIPLELVDADAPSHLLDDQAKILLQDIYEKYGHLNGIQLSDLTHQPGSPWDVAYRPGVNNIEIDDHSIRNHYLGMLNDYRTSTATAAG